MKKSFKTQWKRALSVGLSVALAFTIVPVGGLRIAKAEESKMLRNEYFNIEIGDYGEISSFKLTGDEFDTDYVLNAKDAKAQASSDEHQWMGELMFQTKLEGEEEWKESMTSASEKGSKARTIEREANKVTVTYENEENEKGIQDFKLVETYELVGNQMRWSMEVTNTNDKALTFGDFGLPMPFNEYWTGQPGEYLYETRVLDHSFVGQDSSYIYAQRPSGQGRMLVFTPDITTGAKLEYQDHWRTNNGHPGSVWAQDQGGWANGLNVFYIHSNVIKKTGSSYLENTGLTLAPGENKEYAFHFTTAKDEKDMRSVLYNEGLLDAVAVPSMAFSINMPAKFYLHTKYDISQITDVSVACSHETRLYEGLEKSVSNKQACTKDQGTSVSYVETKTVDGEQYHIYDLKLTCLGANHVIIKYKDDQGQDKETTLQFYAMDSAEDALNLHADFVEKYTQVDAPGEIWDQIFDDWMMDTESVRGVYTGYFGWGDDWGFTHGEYLAEKNVYLPVKEQIEAVDNYLDITIWNGLMREHHEDYLVNDWLDYEPNSTGQGTTRGYAYPHVYNTYFSMYKIASKYPDMIEYKEDKGTYLLRCYNILKALYSEGVFYNWDTGLMGESTTPDIINALTLEGYYDEAQEVINIMAKKYKSFSNQKYPYGSEYSYDNTGEEAVYTLAKLQNNLDMMRKIDLKTRACRGVQPIWYHYGNPTTICGENWWNFQYSASLIGYCMDDWLRLQDNGMSETEKALASRVNYAAKLANLTSINSGQIDASEKNIGTVAWTYQSELGNSGGQGTGGGNIHNGWRQMSGEADTGLFGAMRILSSDVATDPVFGLFGYGCEVEENGNNYEINPLDGLYTRLNLINEGLSLELDKDQYRHAIVSKTKDYVELSMKNLEKTAHTTDIELTGLKEGSYQILVDGNVTGSFQAGDTGAATGAAVVAKSAAQKASTIENVALKATPSAQRTCGDGVDAHISALNNGVDPKSSWNSEQAFGANAADAPNRVWHNWNQHDDPQAEDYEKTCYVQYNWEKEVTINQTNAYYMCLADDNTSQWTPGAATFQYLAEDGETWLDVENPVGMGVEINKYNTTTFDPVTTKGFRMTMEKAEGVLGLGVLEWQVMGTMGSVENVALKATPSAQRTCGDGVDAHISALNNGVDPKSSWNSEQAFGADAADAPNRVWHNWNQHDDPQAEDYEKTCYVQYNWEKEVTINQTNAYYMCLADDNTSQWTPGAVTFQYLAKDGETWLDVENPVGMGVEINKYNATTFDPVTTKGFRMTMEKAEGVLGLGVLEWQVMGTMAGDTSEEDPGEETDNKTLRISIPMPAEETVEVKIIAGEKLDNTAPEVEAGENKEVFLSDNVRLEGAAKDDGYPDMKLHTKWSVVSKPDNAVVTIKNDNKLISKVTFSEAGDYVLQLDVSDGELTGRDTVAYTVKEDEAPPEILAYYTFDNLPEDKRDREVKSADSDGLGYSAERISTPEFKEGKDGLSLSTGSNYCGYVRLPRELTRLVEECTIAVDINMNDLQGANAKIFEFRDMEGRCFYVSVVNGNEISLGVSDTDTKEVRTIVTEAKFEAGYWKNIEVTLKDNTAVLYVEGVEKGRIENCNFKLSDMGDIQRNFLARGDNKLDVFFNGLIDNFTIKSKAMDEAALLKDYGFEGDIKPVSAKTKDLIAMAGAVPELPAEVDILYTDGAYRKGAVTWEKPDNSAFDKKGIVVVKGKAAGLAENVELIIRVVEGDPLNLASAAQPDAIINSVEDLGGVDGLNDGYEPENSADTSHGAWHNWNGNQGGTAWVQYDWDYEVILTGSAAYYFKDGSGNFKPGSVYYEYKDENGDWKQFSNVNGLGTEINQYNETTFDPVMTTAIRMTMSPDTKGCGVLEWKVFGYTDQAIVIKTGLRSVLALAKGITEDMLDKGFETLSPVIEAAEKVMNDKGASQEQVDKAINDLNQVIAKLQAKEDNIAYFASPGTSYVTSWETLGAVNDGKDAKDSFAAGIPHYGTWGNKSEFETVTYAWNSEVEIHKSNIFFWNDQGGIKTPASYKYEYLNDKEEWKEISNPQGLVVALDKYNETTFDPVKTKAFRVTIVKPELSSEGIGLVEWKVIGKFVEISDEPDTPDNPDEPDTPYNPGVVPNPGTITPSDDKEDKKEEDQKEEDKKEGEPVHDKGEVITSGSASYVVTSDSEKKATVTYKKLEDKKKTKVEIPETVTIDGVKYKVTKVGDNVFRNNKTVKTVVISKNVKTIGKNAFRGCSNLTKIVVGSSAAKIEKGAFVGSGKLKTIVIKGSKLKTIEEGAFGSSKQKIKVIVPKKYLKTYQTMFKKLNTSKTFIVSAAK